MTPLQLRQSETNGPIDMNTTGLSNNYNSAFHTQNDSLIESSVDDRHQIMIIERPGMRNLHARNGNKKPRRNIEAIVNSNQIRYLQEMNLTSQSQMKQRSSMDESTRFHNYYPPQYTTVRRDKRSNYDQSYISSLKSTQKYNPIASPIMPSNFPSMNTTKRNKRSLFQPSYDDHMQSGTDQVGVLSHDAAEVSIRQNEHFQVGETRAYMNSQQSKSPLLSLSKLHENQQTQSMRGSSKDRHSSQEFNSGFNPPIIKEGKKSTALIQSSLPDPQLRQTQNNMYNSTNFDLNRIKALAPVKLNKLPRLCEQQKIDNNPTQDILSSFRASSYKNLSPSGLIGQTWFPNYQIDFKGVPNKQKSVGKWNKHQMSTSYWEMAEMPNLKHVNVRKSGAASNEKFNESVSLPKKKVITRDKRNKQNPPNQLKGPKMKNHKIVNKNKTVMKQSLKASPRVDSKHKSPRSPSKSSKNEGKPSPRYESLNSENLKTKKWITPEMYQINMVRHQKYIGKPFVRNSLDRSQAQSPSSINHHTHGYRTTEQQSSPGKDMKAYQEAYVNDASDLPVVQENQIPTLMSDQFTEQRPIESPQVTISQKIIHPETVKPMSPPIKSNPTLSPQDNKRSPFSPKSTNMGRPPFMPTSPDLNQVSDNIKSLEGILKKEGSRRRGQNISRTSFSNSPSHKELNEDLLESEAVPKSSMKDTQLRSFKKIKVNETQKQLRKEGSRLATSPKITINEGPNSNKSNQHLKRNFSENPAKRSASKQSGTLNRKKSLSRDSKKEFSAGKNKRGSSEKMKRQSTSNKRSSKKQSEKRVSVKSPESSEERPVRTIKSIVSDSKKSGKTSKVSKSKSLKSKKSIKSSKKSSIPPEHEERPRMSDEEEEVSAHQSSEQAPEADNGMDSEQPGEEEDIDEHESETSRLIKDANEIQVIGETTRSKKESKQSSRKITSRDETPRSKKVSNTSRSKKVTSNSPRSRKMTSKGSGGPPSISSKHVQSIKEGKSSKKATTKDGKQSGNSHQVLSLESVKSKKGERQASQRSSRSKRSRTSKSKKSASHQREESEDPDVPVEQKEERNYMELPEEDQIIETSRSRVSKLGKKKQSQQMPPMRNMKAEDRDYSSRNIKGSSPQKKDYLETHGSFNEGIEEQRGMLKTPESINPSMNKNSRNVLSSGVVPLSSRKLSKKSTSKKKSSSKDNKKSTSGQSGAIPDQIIHIRSSKQSDREQEEEQLENEHSQHSEQRSSLAKSKSRTPKRSKLYVTSNGSSKKTPKQTAKSPSSPQFVSEHDFSHEIDRIQMQTIATQTMDQDLSLANKLSRVALQQKLEQRIQEFIDHPSDWLDSMLDELVKKLIELPLRNKQQESKELIRQFINPSDLDIFKEEEVGYMSSLLIRMAQTQIILTDEEKKLVEAQYNKAKLTIEVLSEHLRMTLDEENAEGTQPLQQNSPRTCIVLQRCNYKIKSLESLIKMLLRCKKLYDAIQDVMKLLAQVHKMNSVFEEDSIIKSCLHKYEALEVQEKLNSDEEQACHKAMQLLKTLSRRISLFLDENKFFKNFIYNRRCMQEVILEYAHRVCRVLQAWGRSKSTKYKNPVMIDFLQFSEYVDQSSNPPLQQVQQQLNLQDADIAAQVEHDEVVEAIEALSGSKSIPKFESMHNYLQTDGGELVNALNQSQLNELESPKAIASMKSFGVFPNLITRSGQQSPGLLKNQLIQNLEMLPVDETLSQRPGVYFPQQEHKPEFGIGYSEMNDTQLNRETQFAQNMGGMNDPSLKNMSSSMFTNFAAAPRNNESCRSISKEENATNFAAAPRHNAAELNESAHDSITNLGASNQALIEVIKATRQEQIEQVNNDVLSSGTHPTFDARNHPMQSQEFILGGEPTFQEDPSDAATYKR